MRLVCPNCEAKYEVPEDAIPDVGRDVQCASCGHAWFQMRPRPATAVAEAPPPLALEPALAQEAESDSAPIIEPEPESFSDVTAQGSMAAEPEIVDLAEPEPVPVPVEDAAVEEPIAEVEELVADAEPAAPEAAMPEAVEPEAVEPEVMPEPDVAAEVMTEVDLVPEVAAAVPAEVKAPDPQAALLPEVQDAILEAAEATDTDLSVEPDPEPSLQAEAEADAEQDADAADAKAPAATAAAAYAVDESVLAILREEAEREAQARRAEARPLESQPDLGIDAAMLGRGKPSLVTANGASMDGDIDAVLKPSARRDLLPDVEEINSTLRPSEVANDEFIQDGTPPREPRGFRSGFLMVMTVAILGAAVYTAAPRLASMAPSLAGPLDAYVRAIDSLRLSLDGIMQSATVAINGE